MRLFSIFYECVEQHFINLCQISSRMFSRLAVDDLLNFARHAKNTGNSWGKKTCFNIIVS